MAHNLHMHTRYIVYKRTEHFYRALTTYICIQDISCMTLATSRTTASQPTYAYKIYRRIPDVKLPHYVSQPTYAYKIYPILAITAFHFVDSQPTYAYKIYRLPYYVCKTICDSQPTYAYKIYHDMSFKFGKAALSQPTYAYKIYLLFLLRQLLQLCSQPTYAYKIYLLILLCIQHSHTHNLHMHTRYIQNSEGLTDHVGLTTYICIQDISSNKYKYKLPTRIKFVGFIPCREYLLFYIRNLCILSRLKDAEPPLISVRISYVFFVCFSFALLIFKVFSIMSSIFFIPIF